MTFFLNASKLSTKPQKSMNNEYELHLNKLPEYVLMHKVVIVEIGVNILTQQATNIL